MIFLDTCAILYLFSKELRLSDEAFALIEDNDCMFSPMVRLELRYLYDIGRIKKSPEVILRSLYDAIGLSVDDFSFDTIMLCALEQNWTRDPFDRIITAHARCRDAFLISTDLTILKNYSKCRK